MGVFIVYSAHTHTLLINHHCYHCRQSASKLLPHLYNCRLAPKAVTLFRVLSRVCVVYLNFLTFLIKFHLINLLLFVIYRRWRCVIDRQLDRNNLNNDNSKTPSVDLTCSFKHVYITYSVYLPI